MAYDPEFEGNDPAITAATIGPIPSIVIQWPTNSTTQ